MEFDNGHKTSLRPEGVDSEACPCAPPEARGESDFAAALQARYERLSLLTLDLAEEAGEAAAESARAPYRSEQRQLFERRLSAMSRAIWAHGQIERLRTGKAPKGGLVIQNAGQPGGQRREEG